MCMNYVHHKISIYKKDFPSRLAMKHQVTCIYPFNLLVSPPLIYSHHRCGEQTQPSKALLGAKPGKKLVGIAGIGMLVVSPKPAVRSAAMVVAE